MASAAERSRQRCRDPGSRGRESWSGADFPELARDDGEIREWIRDGSPKRLRDNPVAAFFIRRQAIRMPAYGDRVSEDEVRRISGSRASSCCPAPR